MFLILCKILKVHFLGVYSILTVPRWFSKIYQNDHQRCGALCCHTEKEPPRSLEVVGNKKQMTYPIIPKNSKKKINIKQYIIMNINILEPKNKKLYFKK